MDPSEIRDEWADRTGEYSPRYYAHYGPDERSETVLSLVERYAGDDPSVLELGCSSGRHLEHLRRAGISDLTGVELNAGAVDVMEEVYPALVETATVHVEAMETLLERLADDRFDVIFSVQTLQHIHPEGTWVFEEIARVAGTLLVTVEIEGPVDESGPVEESSSVDRDETGEPVNYVAEEIPLYYRDWGAVFEGCGLVQRRCEHRDRDTVRAFTVDRD